MNQSIKTIGIVGFGQMGKIFFEIFSKRFTVLIFDKTKGRKIGQRVASCDMVIFCVPISDLEQAFRNTVEFVKKQAVIMDIASVKEKPAKCMFQIFTKETALIGTHPMFGPHSLKESQRKNVVFCPVRISKQKLHEAKRVFISVGFKIFVMSAKKHDLAMAKSQLLTHLFGQITKNLHIRNITFAPPSFKLMLKAFQIADPNPQLLKEMISQNKFAPQIIREVARQLKNI